MTIRLRAIAALGVVLGVTPPSVAGDQVPRDTRSATPAVRQVGTGVISGTVTVAGSGVPARGARVSLAGQDNFGSRNITTDEVGRFTFQSLPSGRYNLNASKTGFIGATYGQSRPGRPGTPIQLADGSRFAAQLQIFKGGVLTGTILDENGEAIPRTSVRTLRYIMQSGQRILQSSGSGSTDDRGVYRVFGLQPGDYIISATPPNTAPFNDAERLRAEMDMLKERGEAAARVDEAAARDMAARVAAVQAQLAQMPGGAGKDEQLTGYAPVYYPGTVSAGEAAMVPLGPGEERGTLDFQLQRVPIARIEGTVVNPTGQPMSNIQLTLVDSANSALDIGSNTTRAQGDGRFSFNNVAPGQYAIVAQTQGATGPPPPPPPPGQLRVAVARPEPPRYWAMAPVSIDGRILTNVVLSLQIGMTLSGSVKFDASTLQAPTDLTRVRLTLSPVESGSSGVTRAMRSTAAGRVESNGRFTITNVVPGLYRLTASTPGSGWFLESTVVEGQNTLDFPIEIKPSQNLTGATVTFTDRQAELSGTVTNQRGQPAPDCTILVFPSDPRLWVAGSMRIRTTRPATDGRFTLTGLPPGEYRITPIGDLEPGSWYDPAVLQQLDAGAAVLTLNDGEKKVQDLKVSSGGL